METKSGDHEGAARQIVQDSISLAIEKHNKSGFIRDSSCP